MKSPLIVINFKTYKQGKDVVKLAKVIERVSKNIIVGVVASDVSEVVRNTKLDVYCQHVDYFKVGRNTGFVLPEAVKGSGAKGVFLNHSEHKLSFDVLKKTIKRCNDVKLKTMVFANSLREAKQIEKLGVDYIIYEPAELVGGKVSVSEAEPKMIEKISKDLKGNFLVGAGVHSHEDVEVAMKLGASGVALSSAITKARNPAEVLKGLMVN